MENQAQANELEDDLLESTGTELEAAGNDDFTEVQDEFAAYEKTGKLGDADDQVERRIIDEGTLVTLGIMGFALITKNKQWPHIQGRFEVTEPAEFIGEETNFRTRNGLDAKRSEGSDVSGWEITKRTIARIVAAVFQKPLTDAAVNDFLDPAFLAVRDIKDPVEKKLKFWQALTALLNEELKGKTFPTYIGVRPAEGRYKAQQTLGAPQYPGCRKYEKPARD